MKKIYALLLVFACTLMLNACSSEQKSFEITDVHKIVVYAADGEKVEITDTSIIQQITDNINSVQFEKGKSNKDTNGLGTIVQWYDENGNMLEVISVMDEITISYGDNFWTASDGTIDTSTLEHFTDTASTAENSAATEADYDLSSNDAMQVTEIIEKEEVYIVPQSFRTNSTEITVKNKSGVDVDVFLYSENDLNNPINQMTISNGKTKSFENLTSSVVYYIGLSADTSTQLDVSITD